MPSSIDPPSSAQPPGVRPSGAAARQARPRKATPLDATSSRTAPRAVSVDMDSTVPEAGPDAVLALLAGTILGSVLAVIVLPSLLPDLAASLLGDRPKAFWYLSRSAGVVAYLALWLSMVLGLSLTNRFARLWAGGPAIADLHQFVSLLALVLVAAHVLVLLGDPYIGYRLDDLLLPFGSTPYEPFWVGLGQVAAYLALPVALSFYVRRAIGVRGWRLIHYGSFATFVLVVGHGLGAGTDASSPIMLGMYLVTGTAVLFLTVYRVVMAIGRAGTGTGGPVRGSVLPSGAAGIYSFREPASSGRTERRAPGAAARQASS